MKTRSLAANPKVISPRKSHRLPATYVPHCNCLVLNYFF
jgi:hypothetical protein